MPIRNMTLIGKSDSEKAFLCVSISRHLKPFYPSKLDQDRSKAWIFPATRDPKRTDFKIGQMLLQKSFELKLNVHLKDQSLELLRL
jgi:hypothetical protein